MARWERDKDTDAWEYYGRGYMSFNQSPNGQWVVVFDGIPTLKREAKTLWDQYEPSFRKAGWTGTALRKAVLDDSNDLRIFASYLQLSWGE